MMFFIHDRELMCFRKLKSKPRYDVLKSISVGNNVHIGMGAYIFPDVIIGDSVIIAGAVLLKMPLIIKFGGFDLLDINWAPNQG